MTFGTIHQFLMPPTILIVEDHAPLRATLCDWLAAVFDPCTITSAGDGLKATRRIKAALPNTQMVILTVYEDQAHRAEAAAAGASAYLPKRILANELVAVVSTLLQEIS